MKGIIVGLIGLTILVTVAVVYHSPYKADQLPVNFNYNQAALLNNNDFKHATSNILIDRTSQWAANVGHRQSSKFVTDFTETLGAGVCVNDVNNDGWLDILVVGGGGYSRHYGKKAWWHQLSGNQLLLNQQGHYFNKANKEWGLQERLSGISCSFADLDNDGDDDLVLTGLDGVHIFKKETSGFSEVPINALQTNPGLATSSAFADFNQDGFLDIYITRLVKYQKGAKTFEPNRGFTGDSGAPFSPQLFDSASNLLLINQGNFDFIESAKTLGVDNNFGRSLNAKWRDLNRDNWLDLIVINSFDTPIQVFINNSGKDFTRATEQFSALQLPHARSLSFIEAYSDNALFFIPRAMGHTSAVLRENANTSSFKDVSVATKIYENNSQMKNAWGSLGADINNDGFEDIVVLNGMLTPDSDTQFMAQAQADDIFWGTPEGTFEHMELHKSKHLPYSSRDAISADLNNDGLLELIIANNNDDIRILSLQSTQPNNWISIDIGNGVASKLWQFASVTAKSKHREQTKSFDFNQTLFSQGDRRIHFGLNTDTIVEQLSIQSLTGKRVSFTSLAANKHYVFDPASLSLTKVIYENSHDLSILNEDIKLNSEGLFKLLISSAEPRLFDLRSIWKISNASQKKQYLQYIERFFRLEYLWFIEDALNDVEQSLQSSAITALHNLELEQSVRLLTPLLYSQNESIACQVAKVFEFFFDEEEAVLFRKQLAVVPLLDALSEAKLEVQKCILSALGTAENKRTALAILPLLKHEDITLRVSAIHTLGQIRDGRAVPQLAHLLEEENNPLVLAHLLIALEKLSFAPINKFIQQNFHATKTLALPKETQIKTLSHIFSTKQEVVLNKYKLTQLARSYFSNAAIDNFEKQDLLALIEMLLSIKYYLVLPSESTLKIADEVSGTAHAAALLLLVAEGEKTRLSVRDLPLLHKTIALLNDNKVPLSHQVLSEFVAIIDMHSSDLNTHFAFLDKLPNATRPKYLGILYETLTSEQQRDLIRYASNLDVSPPPELMQKLLKSGLHLEDAINWYFFTNKKTISSLDIRIALTKMSKQEAFAQQNKDLVIKAASIDPIVYHTFRQKFPEILDTETLLNIAQNYTKRTTPIPKQVITFAEQVALNPEKSLQQRIWAASLLPQTDLQKQVMINLLSPNEH